MRFGIVLAALAFVAIGFAAFSIGTASAKDNPIVVGASFFCDSSKSGQVCETNVTAGDTVTWTVAAGSHTVTQCTNGTFTSCSSGFSSGTLNPAGTYVRTVDSPGSFFYYCAFHPDQMKGKIVAVAVVTATASPTPVPTGTSAASPATAPSLPSTGGAPGDSGVASWIYGLIALSGVLVIGSYASFALARKRL